MNELIKNLGVIVLLVGVVILAVPALTGGMTNAILLTGLVVIVIGYLSHIIINKQPDLSGLVTLDLFLSHSRKEFLQKFRE